MKNYSNIPYIFKRKFIEKSVNFLRKYSIFIILEINALFFDFDKKHLEK